MGQQQFSQSPAEPADKKLRLAFTLFYPKGGTADQARKDAELIFPGRKADSVYRNFHSYEMILAKSCQFLDDKMVYSVTFRSRREYLEWENELQSNRACDQKTMRRLGYRMKTQKVQV